jgi:predicted DNA-binding protein with PD1-like motif
MKLVLLPLGLAAAVVVIVALVVVAARAAAPSQPSAGASAASPSAPAVQTLESRFTRVVIVRMRNGQDMLDALKAAVAKEGIKNAVILSGAGSLTRYRVHVVDNVTFPPKEAFPEAEGPQDLIAVTGYIIDGRVHAHITFANQEKAMGGHLEPGTKVFTFAIVTLGVLDDKTTLAGLDAWK